jgi:protein SCO1/2
METKRPIWMRIAIPVLILLIASIAGYFLFNILKPYAFHGAVLQSPQPAQDFTLRNQYGQDTSLSDYSGKVVLLYFGYTACPDVCPTTLAEIQEATELLGERADDLQTIMITVDPERDTVEVMAKYLAHFNPHFIGLVGTPNEVAQIATYYGIFFQKQESDSVLGYLVDHTATVMLVDQKGYLRLIFPYGTEGADIAEDIEYVLDH